MRRALALATVPLLLTLPSCGDGGTGNSGGSAGSASTAGAGPGGSGPGGSTNVGGSGGSGNGGSVSNGGGGSGAAGGSGNTGGSTTGPGECTPGATEPCYSGPDGTLDVGICHGGERTCKADGSWGLCLGEITPELETCDTPTDDDCDGELNEEGLGCVCVPGSVGDCYSGPMGTQDVGVCVGGTAICDADGLGYGACEGETVPSPENCLAASDEDCSGAALACTGDDVWHKRFGDAGAQSATSVAGWNGGAVVAGKFAGTVDFGGGNLVSAGGDDAFVASYDYLGAHVWSKRFGDAVAQTATGVAVDGAGDVIVVGDYAGKIDLGGGMLTSAGGNDIFVAKYDAIGTFLWAKSFGDSKAQNVTGVATDADGRIAITGSFAGDLAFGGDLLTTAGAADIFVAVFDANGDHVWSKRFGDAAAQTGKAVAFGPMGELALAGDNAGTIDLGGGNLATAGGNDVFLASFDATGTHLWSKEFGNNAAQVANALTVDGVGNVVLGCSFAGTVNFGGGNLISAGGTDVGLARFTTGGMLLWAKKLGAAGADNARGVAVDPFGAIVIAGDFSNSVDFGGGQLASAGGTDVFVAKYDALGAHVWSKRAGDNGAQTAAGADADASGVVVAGTFAGAINFGGGAQTSAGGNDVFLVKLAQ